LMRKLNGYFDSRESVENLHRFRQMYKDSSRETDLCTVHMSSRFGDALDGGVYSQNKLQYLYGIRKIMCWRFIENCTYFLKSFQEWGSGKRVLVVSPFSQSITFQTGEDRVRHLLQDEYKFPECEFTCVDTPITYNTEGWFCESNSARQEDWFSTADQLFANISKEDFDVAWLSCGSYAMYLGPKIKRDLGKDAIYIGGMANVFFNLYNFRYSSTGHDLSVVNPAYQIDALEHKRLHTPENVNIFPYSEGLRAYLGEKPDACE